MFDNYLNSQPIYCVFNTTQKVCLIGSFLDVLFLDMPKKLELDIDNQYKIGDVRGVVYHGSKFYVLANKCNKMLGYYLLEIREKNPITTGAEFLINWKSKLDIGDAAINLLEDPGQESDKSIVICFKSIFINTYNIMVVSLKTKQILIKHEHSHLYECSIGALLLKLQNDLILFSKDGMIVLNLGTSQSANKRAIKDSQDVDYYLHTLSSCKDLRLEESNHLKFSRKE